MRVCGDIFTVLLLVPEATWTAPRDMTGAGQVHLPPGVLGERPLIPESAVDGFGHRQWDDDIGAARRPTC
ncbi:hypothetical protein GCM10027053_37750 [Intrasporangium mesophilum]